MSGGIRVELTVDEPGTCPVAMAAEQTGVTIEETTRASEVGEGGEIAEEFRLPADVDLDMDGIEPIFAGENRRVYRFGRAPDLPCVCRVVEREGCPVSDVRACDGRLSLSFYAADLNAVQSVVESVSGRFDGVAIRQLTQRDDSDNGSFVFVDRGTLTRRQREVLETSYEMGYFDYPRGANASEIAAALEISPSTFREHMAAAQRKVLGGILDA